jgi:hypothetical protein
VGATVLGWGDGGAARGNARRTHAHSSEGKEARGGEGCQGRWPTRPRSGRMGQREVGDAPDRWGPPVGEGKKGRGREVRCGFVGPEEKDGSAGG